MVRARSIGRWKDGGQSDSVGLLPRACVCTIDWRWQWHAGFLVGLIRLIRSSVAVHNSQERTTAARRTITRSSENDRERSVVSTHPAKPLGAPTPPQLAATYQHACDSHSCSHGLVSQRLCGGLAKSWCLCTHHCVMCGRAAAPVAPARRCKRENCSVSQCTLQALAWRSTASAGRSFRNGCFSQMSRPEGFDSSSTPACPSSG